MTTTFVTTLYQGKDVPQHSKNIFDASWCDKLYRGLDRFCPDDFELVCLVDQDYKFDTPVRAVPLNTGHRNMWCLLECLRGDYSPHDRVFMGLDTIITGDLTDIVNLKPDFAMIRDPYYPQRLASGVMAFTAEIGDSIYQKWLQDENKGRFKMMNCVSDMIWLDANVPKDSVTILQDCLPDQILSYKAEILEGVPSNDVRMLYFHGNPKPHELRQDDYWRRYWC